MFSRVTSFDVCIRNVPMAEVFTYRYPITKKVEIVDLVLILGHIGGENQSPHNNNTLLINTDHPLVFHGYYSSL